MVFGKKGYGGRTEIVMLVIGIVVGIVISCIAGSLTNKVCGFIPL